MNTPFLCSQIRQSSHLISQNILDTRGPLSYTRSFRLFLPALIAAAGSVTGLSIGSVAGLSASRVCNVLGNVLGTVPVLVSVEAAAIALSDLDEKLDPLIKQAKFPNCEHVEKIRNVLKSVQHHFNTFLVSLEPEQADVFFSVLDEWDYYCTDASQPNPRSQFSKEVDIAKAEQLEEIASAFYLTQKQRELIDQLTSVSTQLFQVEAQQVKGLEILCKLFSIEKEGVYDKFASALMLTPRQKQLFNDFVSTLNKEKINEDVLYVTIQFVLQAQVNSKIVSSFGLSFKMAQGLSFLAVPLYTFLTILKPIGLLEIIKPLGMLWGALQMGSLMVGALTVAYIYHQCFHLNIQAEIHSHALQIREVNGII